ncbi:MAG: UDP-3-O-(3-hydroxymyristoyl)glucosamine N-acyltransferase [Nitrospinaceae bacterium]|nr:UDP-3-O-(3-hydroxymyristoyl)glucosamine N-acyltransferase [Nitrospinota bacterium]MDP7147147.1 UDP-3-O-(3-hydroxymyristoyl)glucosamine N-acyltransferase [Nitrospinaceae bacterium]
MNLGDIAEKIGGKVIGDASLEITDVRHIESAEEGHLTFLTGKKFLDKLKQSKASAVLVDSEQEVEISQVITPGPMLAFARLLDQFHPQSRPKPGIHPSVILGENVVLGKRVTLSALVCVGDNVQIDDDTVVYPSAVIGSDCSLGKNTVIHSNVTLYNNSVIGNHVILHAGVVVGADGFGYTLDEKGRHVKINQIGNVVIEDNVEVGANSCIDRAAMGTTLIKEGTKIDNLVQVAHNCTIGEHSILVAQVGIAGSCELGHHVVLAGQAGVSDHVKVGDQVTVVSKSAVLRDLEGHSAYGGIPAVPLNIWKRSITVLPKLPDLARKIRDLESRLNDIEKKKSEE